MSLFKKRRFLSSAIGVFMCGCMMFNTATPVFANSITESGGSGKSDVTVTMKPSIFSATVPYVLPISVDADQNVTVANNAQIINNSNGPIKVSSAVLTANNDWSLVEDGTDFSSVPVNSKQFTMEMQGSPVETSGVIDKSVFSFINGNDSLPITYNADVAVQGDSLSGVNIANVVFTLKWDDFRSYIPEGGTYTIKSMNTILTSGQDFPDEPATGDTYEYGDYIYAYNKGGDYGTEWSVKVKDKTKSSYGKILSKIDGKPVTNMRNTFYNCKALTIVPKIPNSVTSMVFTFDSCASLITAPIIPNSVTEMVGTFYNCTSLVTAPIIPNSVTTLSNTFKKCTSLVIAPTIPNDVMNISWTFYGCKSLKTYEGSTDSDGDFSNYKIPSSITSMEYTFTDCTSLTTAPIIPNDVMKMVSTFQGCSSLTTAPTIPNGVTDMSGTFKGCTSLTTAPTIPDGVKKMFATFNDCIALTIAPTIPNSVKDMMYTFMNCNSLTGTITINANPSSYSGCFVLKSTGKDITLTGESTRLQEIANTSSTGYRTVYDINGNILKQ